jgi:hypothetical protein
MAPMGLPRIQRLCKLDLRSATTRGWQIKTGEVKEYGASTGWVVLGLDGDPTPGVVETVQGLAKQFGDFAHDVQSAYGSLNSFGADTTALG